MSRSIRKETSSLAFGIVGRFGGSSAGFVVAALNAASAASREVVVLRVLSAGIYVLALGLHSVKRKLDGPTKACDRRRSQCSIRRRVAAGIEIRSGDGDKCTGLRDCCRRGQSDQQRKRGAHREPFRHLRMRVVSNTGEYE